MIRNVQGSFDRNLETDEKLPKFAQHHKTQLWTWADCRSSELPACGILLLAIAAVDLFTDAKTAMIRLTCLQIHFVKKFLRNCSVLPVNILMFVVVTQAL